MNEIVYLVTEFMIILLFGLFVVDASLTLGAKVVAFGTSAFDHIRIGKKRK